MGFRDPRESEPRPLRHLSFTLLAGFRSIGKLTVDLAEFDEQPHDHHASGRRARPLQETARRAERTALPSA